MKRLVTVTGPVATAQMDGYLIEERLLDHIMIQVIDKGGGNLDIAFHERDRRYLSQFSEGAAGPVAVNRPRMLTLEQTSIKRMALLANSQHRRGYHRRRS